MPTMPITMRRRLLKIEPTEKAEGDCRHRRLPPGNSPQPSSSIVQASRAAPILRHPSGTPWNPTKPASRAKTASTLRPNVQGDWFTAPLSHNLGSRLIDRISSNETYTPSANHPCRRQPKTDPIQGHRTGQPILEWRLLLEDRGLSVPCDLPG